MGKKYLTDKEKLGFLKSKELKQIFKDLSNKYPNPKNIKIKKPKSKLILD